MVNYFLSQPAVVAPDATFNCRIMNNKSNDPGLLIIEPGTITMPTLDGINGITPDGRHNAPYEDSPISFQGDLLKLDVDGRDALNILNTEEGIQYLTQFSTVSPLLWQIDLIDQRRLAVSEYVRHLLKRSLQAHPE